MCKNNRLTFHSSPAATSLRCDAGQLDFFFCICTIFFLRISSSSHFAVECFFLLLLGVATICPRKMFLFIFRSSRAVKTTIVLHTSRHHLVRFLMCCFDFRTNCLFALKVGSRHFGYVGLSFFSVVIHSFTKINTFMTF